MIAELDVSWPWEAFDVVKGREPGLSSAAGRVVVRMMASMKRGMFSDRH